MTDTGEAKARWSLLALLVSCYVCSAVDRTVIALLVDPIKADLHLSDSQISYLQGFAFMLVYAVMGVPAGIMLDRHPRLKITAVAVTVWSLMTAGCGLARSFATLFVARAGVGVGESVLGPAAYSLIGDAFPPERHGLALGIYTCGGMAGVAIALGGGGILYDALATHGDFIIPVIGTIRPWQMLFITLLPPGLALAILLAVFPEPQRLQTHMTGPIEVESAWTFMLRYRRLFIPFFLAVSFQTLVAHAVGTWAATFIKRTFDTDIATAGMAAGMAYVLGGIPGLLGGGVLSDWLIRFGLEKRLWVCMGGALVGALCGGFLGIADNIVMATMLIAVIAACASMPLGIATAALQEITPSTMRGRVSATFLLCVSLIGAAGPSIVAWITDYVLADEKRLDLSLSLTTVILLLLALIAYGAALKPFKMRAEDHGHPARRKDDAL